MPAFQFSLNRHWRKLGLQGKLAWATVHDGALQLQDDSNHIARIMLDDIARIRIGAYDSKRRYYYLRIWRGPQDKMLMLSPDVPMWSGYRDTMNELANALIERGRMDRIETGTSKFDALFGATLMAMLTLASYGIALFVLTNEPWWGRMIVPALPTIVLAILIWLGRNRYWPRPLLHLNDLKSSLPPG